MLSVFTFYFVGEVLGVSCGKLKGESNTPTYMLFKLHMQKLQGFKSLLVDDPKPTHKHNVKVVDIFIINVHLLCKIVKGCLCVWC